MPKGIHNNKRGGRPAGPCSCSSTKKCQVCIHKDHYMKHKQETKIRQMDRYWTKKGKDLDVEFERKLIAKFEQMNWN